MPGIAKLGESVEQEHNSHDENCCPPLPGNHCCRENMKCSREAFCKDGDVATPWRRQGAEGAVCGAKYVWKFSTVRMTSHRSMQHASCESW
jgi:hypothetical protein